MLSPKVPASCGLLSVASLVLSITSFGMLEPDFSFTQDYISELGAKGSQNGWLFNLTGFVLTGILITLFGIGVGFLHRDPLLSILLGLFGLGFAFTAIPINLENPEDSFSTAHVLAICLGLASWMFALSRLGSNRKLPQKVRLRANITAGLLFLSMMGFITGLWSMPITHRLVFGMVFGWTSWTSIELLDSSSGFPDQGASPISPTEEFQ